MRHCVRCGEHKQIEGWPASKQHKSGLFPYCLDCKRAACRESYRRHTGRRIAEVAAYQQRHPERVRAAKKRYVERHPERRQAARRAWQQRHMQTVVRASNARRRAIRAAAPTLPFTAQQLEARLSMFNHCCWVCHGEANAIDHVKPLSRGGWHCLSNLRPICRPCNTRKLNHWPYLAA